MCQKDLVDRHFDQLQGKTMIRQILRSSMAMFVLLLAAPAVLASSLSYNPANNQNLTSDHYGFAKYHSPLEASRFSDTWEFSLAEDSKVSLGIRDIEFGLHSMKLLDISNMSIVFDGASLSEGTWFHAMLDGGTDYAFTVAGDVSGLLGGAYKGKLSVSAVPLPAAAWLFLSALAGLFVIRRRQQPQIAAA